VPLLFGYQLVHPARAAGKPICGSNRHGAAQESLLLTRSGHASGQGQLNLTDAQYTATVAQQLHELWTNYGALTEVWVDSALGGFGDLMQRLQPQASGTPKNPTGWCGTESGHPSRDVGGADVWSTGSGYHGDPASPKWLPKFCDPQLFRSHTWFWEPGLAVRSLSEMIPIFHDIVGRGMVMELAFSIDRDGLVQDTHAAVYAALGACKPT
jgi:hypothetical protein